MVGRGRVVRRLEDVRMEGQVCSNLSAQEWSFLGGIPSGLGIAGGSLGLGSTGLGYSLSADCPRRDAKAPISLRGLPNRPTAAPFLYTLPSVNIELLFDHGGRLSLHYTEQSFLFSLRMSSLDEPAGVGIQEIPPRLAI